MSLLGRLKLWAIAAVAVVGVILTTVAMIFNAGRRQQKSDDIILDRIQEEKVDDRIEDAVDEGERIDDSLRTDDGFSDDLREDDGFKRQS